MGRWWKKIQNKQYGQAMVEFALTLPIFLLFLIGIIELSRFFLVYSSVYTASREATRYGSAAGTVSVGGNDIYQYQDCSGIINTAVDMGWFGGINAADVNVYYESAPGVEPTIACGTEVPLGTRVVVEVSSIYQPLLVGWVLPDGITVNSSNGRTIIKEIKMVATPMDEPICNDDVIFNPSDSLTVDKKIAYVDVENTSTFSNYSLVGIYDILDNINPTDKNYLAAIYWGGDLIWSTKDPNEVTPTQIVDFEKDETRNLPAGFTKRIIFEYKFILPNDFSAGFRMQFQNAANYGLYCNKSISLD